MIEARNMLRFCSSCGRSLSTSERNTVRADSVRCPSCGTVLWARTRYNSPSLLVITGVFAEDRILLLKRGIPPYVGQWAPAGGFLEAGESVEAAAVREVREEVGLVLNQESLIPHGVVSLPKLNQVHLLFLAVLEKAEALHPNPPEALDARWFLEEEIPWSEVWEPHGNFGMARIFGRVRSGRLDYYQQAGDWLRVISEDGQFTYLWRADPAQSD